MSDWFIVQRLPMLALVWFMLASVQLMADENVDPDPQTAALQGDYAKATEMATSLLKADPGNLRLLYARGRWHFQLGHMAESLADFDELLRRDPESSARLWERGITCYYAGKYAEGSQQFERYQTFYSNDVENSVWRFLCDARIDGLEKARSQMLPIESDRRVPMMQVYRLFRGQAKPADVLKELEPPAQDSSEAREHAFMAYLYLGLYYDSHHQPEPAKKYIDLAVEQYVPAAPRSTESNSPNSQQIPAGHYMWDVARQHQRSIQQERLPETQR